MSPRSPVSSCPCRSVAADLHSPSNPQTSSPTYHPSPFVGDFRLGSLRLLLILFGFLHAPRIRLGVPHPLHTLHTDHQTWYRCCTLLEIDWGPMLPVRSVVTVSSRRIVLRSSRIHPNLFPTHQSQPFSLAPSEYPQTSTQQPAQGYSQIPPARSYAPSNHPPSSQTPFRRSPGRAQSP